MAAAAAAAASASAATRRLVCGTLGTLSARLPPGSRLLAFDVSGTHLSVAVSDTSLRQAAPFGLLRRSATARRDGAVLRSAFEHPDAGAEAGAEADHAALRGIVVGCAPGPAALQRTSAYVLELLSNEDLLPDVDSLLFYSEAAALRHAARRASDVYAAAQLLTDAAESRKPPRFEAAMYHPLDDAELRSERSVRASISAADILQAALDDLARLEVEAK